VPLVPDPYRMIRLLIPAFSCTIQRIVCPGPAWMSSDRNSYREPIGSAMNCHDVALSWCLGILKRLVMPVVTVPTRSTWRSGTPAETMGSPSSGGAGLLSDVGGTVGGLLNVLNTDHPDAVHRLDDLANAFVTEVNAIHTTGTNPDGNTGVDFFDAAGTGASTIALTAAVLASADAIAAGTPDGGGAYDVALGIAALRDLDVGLLGSTVGEHHQALVSDVGQAVRSSSESAEVSRVLSDQADLRRMQLSGVSLDEEFVSIIEFQTAYQASARVLTAANDMIQTLLTI